MGKPPGARLCLFFVAVSIVAFLALFRRTARGSGEAFPASSSDELVPWSSSAASMSPFVDSLYRIGRGWKLSSASSMFAEVPEVEPGRAGFFRRGLAALRGAPVHQRVSKEQRAESAILFNFHKAPESQIDLDDVLPGHIWVPISIDKFDSNSGGTVKVKMCQLNYDDYAAKPWVLPMGGLLNQHSGCADIASPTVKILTVSSLELALARDRVQPMPPTGFVYHETRCGSTLAANMLASVPSHLMWSESTGPWKVLHTCKNCPTSQIVRYLRVVMGLMGRSQRHNRVFFKFQNSDDIVTYSAAFPDTPWMYLFRDPVEVMMSRLGAQRIGMEGMQDDVEGQLTHARNSRTKPGAREKSVATTLFSLSAKAIEASARSPGMGMMVEYVHLPNVLADVVLPSHFHVTLTEAERAALMAPAAKYSKVAGYVGKDNANVGFKDDKDIKHDNANQYVQQMARDMLGAQYQQLQDLQDWLAPSQ